MNKNISARFKPFLSVVISLVVALALLSHVSFAFAFGFSFDIDEQQPPANNAQPLRALIGQKLMLDFRYYCEQPTIACRTPMTSLPNEVAALIREQNIGGVILFSENLETNQQIKHLTQNLQSAAASSELGTQLFITIDQEGGRVARLPLKENTPFSGNMALGATFAKHGDKYAVQVGEAIGKQLSALGFNLNFAPNVDVNSNPHNPVINIRSFSDSPNIVAELAAGQIMGMNKSNVSATLKHFPGHGDTSVDSHTGLPRVDKARAQINALELVPFKKLISSAKPDFIMTAHIQYPALDSSEVKTKTGASIIKPATFSHKIVTQLLKQDMGFEGIVISDALDMGAISQNFNPVDAVINTFAAGVDIALMPIQITSKRDIPKVIKLIDDIEAAIKNKRLNRDEFVQSAKKVMALKHAKNQKQARYSNLSKNLSTSINSNLSTSHGSNNSSDNRSGIYTELSQQLAQSSLVQLTSTPLTLSSQGRLLIVMPDTGKCQAMLLAASQYTRIKPTCVAITQSKDIDQLKTNDFDVLILGSLFPKQASYEMLGVKNDERRQYAKVSPKALMWIQKKLLRRFNAANIKTVFVSLRMPYDLQEVTTDASSTNATNIDHAYATFSYTLTPIELSPNKLAPYKLKNDSFSALMQHFYSKGTPKHKLTGKLPIKRDSVCPRDLISCGR
jgi:beta-N-acetylhexosaminidase